MSRDTERKREEERGEEKKRGRRRKEGKREGVKNFRSTNHDRDDVHSIGMEGRKERKGERFWREK